MQRLASYCIVALAFAALAGCTVRSVSVGYYDDRPHHHHDVYVDHICTYDCHDHYWDGHRIVVIQSGHRHHPGCGHYWDGRHWVIVRTREHHPDVVIRKAPPRRAHTPPTPVKRVKRVKHVHGPTCGCAWDRRERVWVRVEDGHVHGRNCGHIYVAGKWCLPR